jgi:hypothetical protein
VWRRFGKARRSVVIGSIAKMWKTDISHDRIESLAVCFCTTKVRHKFSATVFDCVCPSLFNIQSSTLRMYVRSGCQATAHCLQPRSPPVWLITCGWDVLQHAPVDGRRPAEWGLDSPLGVQRAIRPRPQVGPLGNLR